jgi:hypothetical protein
MPLIGHGKPEKCFISECASSVLNHSVLCVTRLVVTTLSGFMNSVMCVTSIENVIQCAESFSCSSCVTPCHVSSLNPLFSKQA